MMSRNDPGLPLIIGIGSARGADRFGWDVIEFLHDQKNPPPCHLEICNSPALLSSSLLAAKRAIIVDAMLGPGCGLRWLSVQDIPATLGIGSVHGMGVCEAINLSVQLGVAKDSVRLLCLEVPDPDQKVCTEWIEEAARRILAMISCACWRPVQDGGLLSP